MTEKVFHIIGQVLDRKTRRGVAELGVEAWDKDLVYDDQVGSAVTDTLGWFQHHLFRIGLQGVLRGPPAGPLLQSLSRSGANDS